MILKTLMFKPVVYTDHAICRMKCRYYVLKLLLLFVILVM